MQNRDAEPPEASSHRDPLAVTAKHLFAARTVLVFGEVTMALAESVTAQLLALAAASGDPIPPRHQLGRGATSRSGDTIHDVIRFIEPEVRILGTGWVASAGALIFAAAERRLRFALPNTRFLLHQPTGGVGGRASDIEIEALQLLATRERLNRIFAEATGQTFEKIARDTERNHWMTAEEAKAYGLVGRIVESASAVDG